MKEKGWWLPKQKKSVGSKKTCRRISLPGRKKYESSETQKKKLGLLCRGAHQERNKSVHGMKIREKEKKRL